MGDHNIILQSQRPNICLFLPFDPQSDSKSKSKSQRCDQRPDMLSTVLEILDWTQIFEATHRAIVKKRIGGAVVEPGISLSKHLCLFMRRSRAQKIESGKSGKRTVEIERGLSTNIPWISLNKTSLYDKENIVWRLIDFFYTLIPLQHF